MTTLSELHVGDVAKVVSFQQGNRPYRQKLIALGLTPGITFEIKRVAPLGDPVEICVRGYSLSLRKQEAAILCVERVSECAI